MTKLSRTEKAARLDAFLSNDDNFVAIAYDDPRAVALRAKAAKRNHRTAAARALAVAESVQAAGAFTIGQCVKLKARPLIASTIVAINGDHIALANGRTFVASALIAA